MWLKLGLLVQVLGPGWPVDILSLALTLIRIVAVLETLLTAIGAGVLLPKLNECIKIINKLSKA